ncbi:MAG: penicillin-binding protein 1C [Bacteroidota bacterium]
MISWRRQLRAFLLVCIAPLLFFLSLTILFPLPDLKPYSLLVEDRNGRFVHAFISPDGFWRLRTDPEEIPDKLKTILVAREDRWFSLHPGVNPLALFRASFQNVRAGRTVSGASTITMQIARMLEPKERTYLNKLVEMFRALQLEWRYSKQELLEIYLSMVPLGGNVEGLASASLLYHQTPPERLNIAQLLDLILVPGDPNGLRPDRQPERLLRERRRAALRLMRWGLLSREDSLVIWNTPSAAVRRSLPRHAPHFSLRVKRREEGKSLLRTSLDLRIQREAETLLANHLRPWKQLGVSNGALLVLENSSGKILAYVGSEDFNDEGAQGQVDGVQALRSPGSTLKPFLYALQMERGRLTPKTRLLDTPYDAEGFLAVNYDGTYAGLLYADEALRRSLNVPMIRLLKQTGTSDFVDFAVSAGLASLGRQRPRLGLSVILGGCGVTLEELTGAYAAFPRAGLRCTPGYLLDTDPAAGADRIFSETTAYMLTDMLSSIERPDLPNNSESSLTLPTVAFKTGTSYGRRDAWTIGYTADHTVGVWIGNSTNTGNANIVGRKTAAPLAFDLLNSLSHGPAKAILRPPRDLGLRMVCANSGLPPTPRCEQLIEDQYDISRPGGYSCSVCKEYLVSPDRAFAYCSSCLGSSQYEVVRYTDFNPELLDFWRSTGVELLSPPPHAHFCTRVFHGTGPVIQSPSDGMTYYLVGEDQQLFLKASSQLDVREHVWYVGDRYLGRRKAGERLFTKIDDGDHTVSCMDDRGRISSVRIRIRRVL